MNLYPSSVTLLISLIPIIGHLLAFLILSTVPISKITDKIFHIINILDPFTWIMKATARKIINNNLTSINKKYQDQIIFDEEAPIPSKKDESEIKNLEHKLETIGS